VDYQSLLIQHLSHIDRVVQGVARRHQLSADDTEELISVVRFKLLDKDFAILRKFEGRSSITTYLSIVVERLCLDYFNEQWGKWRPSAAAKRMGGTAIHLEQLVLRDGLTFEEAAATLQTNHHVQLTRDELLTILAQLPVRTIRRCAGEEELALVAVHGGAPDPSFGLPEEYELVVCIDETMEKAIADLPEDDQLVLKLRFWDGMPVAGIARLLQCEPRSLYNRLSSLAKQLRKRLDREGIDRPQVGRVIGHPALTLGRLFDPRETEPPENGDARPSKA
jgi:RNA polymerase sigma factor for flagellar operon FliA